MKPTGIEALVCEEIAQRQQLGINKYGTTVAKLKAANGLKSDLIRAGKTLKIPR
jgi:hypothetical protein